MRRWGVVGGTVLAGLTILLTLALLVLHAPFVRAAVLRWAAGVAGRQAGVRVTAADLAYDLLTLEFRVRELRVAAAGAAEPFLAADDLEIDLPWRALLGGVAVDRIDVRGLVVDVVRGADGRLNLPDMSAGDAGGAGPSRVDIGGLRLGGARVRYRDLGAGLEAGVEGLDLQLTARDGGAIAGPLTTARGPFVRMSGLDISGVLQGTLTYDGTALAISALTYDTPQGRLQAGGRIASLWNTPTSSLDLQGTVRLADVSRLLQLAPEDTVDGVVTMRANVRGNLSAPAATLTIASDELRWRHLAVRTVAAGMSADRQAVRLERAAFSIERGVVDASGRLSLDTWQAGTDVAWRGVPARALVPPTAGVDLDAVLAGSATLSWNLNDGLRGMRARADTTSASTGGRGLGVDGLVAATLDEGRWTLRGDPRLAGDLAVGLRLAGGLDASALEASTVEGRIVASVAAARVPFVARRLGIEPPSYAPESGRIDAALSVGGTFAAPRAAGAITADDVRVSGSVPMGAVLPLAATPSSLRITGARVLAGANRLDGDVEADFDTGALGGTLAVEVVDVVALGGAVAGWRPAGRLSGDVVLGGSTRAPEARATLAGEGVAVANQQVERVRLGLAYEPGVVRVSDLELEQSGGGRASGQVRYALDSGRAEVALRLDRWRVTPVESPAGNWPVAGVIDGVLDASGTREHPTGGGRVEVTGFQWADARVDRAVLDVSLSDAGVTGRLDVPSFASRADVRVGLSQPYAMTLTATAEGTALATVLAALGLAVPAELQPFEGIVDARVDAAGPLEDPSAISAEVDVSRLDVRTGQASIRLAGPAAARYGAGRATIDALHLESGATRVDVSGSIGAASLPGVTVTVNGSLDDVEPWLAATGLSLDGSLSGTVHASGSLDRVALDGSLALAQGRVTWPGYPAATDLSATMTIADGVVTVPAMRAVWQEAVASGDLRLPLAVVTAWLPGPIAAAVPPAQEPATARVRLDNVTPAVLAALAADAAGESLAGSFSVDAELRADGPTLGDLSGRVEMRDLAMSAEGVPIAQTSPTRLEIAAGTVRVAEWSWTVAGSRLDVRGQADLAGDRRLDLSVGGALDLRVLGAFLPDVAAGGVGDLALAIGGTASAPAFDGTMRLTGAELRVRDPALSLSGVSGLVALRPDAIDVTGLEGELNGGRVVVIGGLGYGSGGLTSGSLSIQASGVALDVPRGLRTEVDTSLAVTVGTRVLVSGQVEIARGAYREPLSLAVGLVAATRRVGPTGGGGGASALDAIDLNVRLASAEDLIVDNNYGRMDLGLDVRLVGTAAVPSIVGRATIREGGVLFLGGRSYLVDRGVIDFSNPRAIVPDLDLSARTRIRGTDESNTLREYDITIAITGTPDTVRATLTSDPPRGQADIASLLATGRLADQVGGAGAAVAGEQVLGYLSGDALAFAAQAIGVDAIRFERDPGVEALTSDPSLAAEVSPVQRLTFSRRVTEKAQVTLSQNLVDTGLLTWIVAYAARPAVEVRTVSRDDRSRSYEVRHDLAFGGPPPEPSTTSRAPASDRVAAVRVSGEGAFREEEARAVLRLSPGDRFDFYRWQDDRDRLRQHYLDRGYREVRITARRLVEPAPGGEPGIALEYVVVTGPRAELEIRGVRLPGRVVRQLEVIWDDAVIDVALLGDLAEAVRRHLAEDGYLRASVDASPVPATLPDEKRIAVTVEPGPRTPDRRIQFSGDEGLPREVLNGITVRLGVDAWLQPRRLADEIALEYQQRGFMAATVAAGPVEFTDGAAVLPVRIVEGAPFVVGRVAVRGATARSENTARADFALEPGAPYTVAEIRRATAALEAAYHRDGFNMAVVTIGTSVVASRQSVDLDVSIDEGPRQILESVQIRGAEGVHPDVVSRALDLNTGGPVNLEAWYASRRRLSQTGLFQRVDVEPTPIEGAAQPGLEPVRAEVSLVRRVPWRLRYGVDVSDVAAPLAEQGRIFAAGLSANLERYGLWGRSGTVGGLVRANADRRIFRGFLTLPSFFGRSATSNLFVSRSRDVFDREGFVSFVTDKTTFTAEQRFRVRPTIQAAYGYQFERNHLFEPEPDPGAIFPLDERLQQARLTATITLDTRNDPFDPSRGLFHASSAEYAPEALGSDVRFVKYSLQQYLFVEPVARVVTASAVRFGIGRGFGQRLIPSERFFAGGGTTVRGFADNLVGGVDGFGDPIGGQGVLVLNQEVRFPLFRWVRGVGFVDAGKVFERVGVRSFGGLDVSAGAGLRISTPFGLLRVDLAAPLPRRERPARWWFSFGQAF